MYLHQPYFFSPGIEVFNGFLCRFGSGPHQHNDPLGIGRAIIVEEVVLSSDDGSELVHGLLHDLRRGKIEGVAGFSGLEKDIRILGRASQDRIVRRQPPHAVSPDEIVVDHLPHIIQGELLDFHDFMRSAKSVEKVHKRDAGSQSSCLRDQRKVHDFLDRIRYQHSPAGGPDRHDVAVVTVNGQSMRRYCSGRDVKHGRGQFSRNLEHIGDHEQEALGGSECCGQSARLKGAVHCSRSAAFALHFRH